MCEEWVVAAQSARAFILGKGDLLEIVDLEGRQVADFFAVSAARHDEYFSPGVTAELNESLGLGSGSLLYSTRFYPMFEVVRDDVGVHDLTIPCCRGEAYAFYGSGGSHPNCLDNINAALSGFGVRPFPAIAPLNVFMRVEIRPDRRLDFLPPLSRPGDRFALRTLMESVVAVAACSSDIGACNDGLCKPIGVRLTKATDLAAQ